MSEEARAATASLPEKLVVMALKAEGQGLFERRGIPVLYTGLGKVNAAITLTQRLSAYRHAGRPSPLVINFGTAGSPRFATGALIGCNRFVQRDMDVRALGFAYGVTPYEDTPAELAFAPMFTSLSHGLCGSGDSFATGESLMHCEVVDMEAYAYAKACLIAGAHFVCAKYITDGADHAAAGDWAANLPAAAAAFLQCYESL